MECYVCVSLFNGVEARTLKGTTINRLEALHLCLNRKICNVPWIEHATNEHVLERKNSREN